MPKTDTARDLIEGLRESGSAEGAFAKLLRHIEPPDPVGCIYAFGGDLDRGAGHRPRTRLDVVGNDTGMSWWREYAADPVFRLDDPVRARVRRELAPIDWQETAERGSRFERQCLWHPLWDRGITQGSTVPVHEPSRRRYGCVTFLHYGARAPFDRWIEGRQSDVTAAIYCLHDALRTLRPPRPRTGTLSPRQRECLAGVAAGRTSKQIARSLGLSPKTVDMHIAVSVDRLGARTRAQAVSLAIRLGLLDA